MDTAKSQNLSISPICAIRVVEIDSFLKEKRATTCSRCRNTFTKIVNHYLLGGKKSYVILCNECARVLLKSLRVDEDLCNICMFNFF